MKKTRIIELFLIITLTALSFSCLAEVNCNRDYQNAGNLVIKGNNTALESKQLDQKHEKLIYQANLTEAKNALIMASELANDAIIAYTEAKVLYDGILDYGCRYKIKKSRKRVNYIEYRLDHLQYKVQIMKLMSKFL